MRFTFVLSGLFAVLAAAADSGSATVSVDPAQKSQLACLDKCPKGDVDCQAHCITVWFIPLADAVSPLSPGLGVPSPNQSQANATTQCAAKCPQGDGSVADTKAFAACIDKCIHEHYYVTSKGTPEATGAPGGNNAASGSGSDTTAAPTGSSASDASGTGSGASETGSATTGTTTGTRTGSAATTSTTNAAPAIIASGGALVGVLAALLAL
ncbi:hypothetical protein TARUN_4334 [Trichoderma arundinaceum]|uniref:Uncharacterized protein n=1 Tax=Trichoderma arundinaceum TaxID=490622 RepID=A0A395NPG6_TRIAR|nr:hypothetical protein TARUN_4334 [Trichoderma arundinaceum]